MGFIVSIPCLIVFQVAQVDNFGFFYCLETWSNPIQGQVNFVLVNFTCSYLAPCFIILFLNGIIYRQVGSRECSESNNSIDALGRMHRRTSLKVRTYLSFSMFFYFIFWLPLYIIAFIVKFSADSTQIEESLAVIFPSAQLLGSSISSVNPLLYAFRCKKFRKLSFRMFRVFR